MEKESIYIVVEELYEEWLEGLFEYWFQVDISKEIKGNGEYFPFYYYKFKFDKKYKDEILEILAEVFIDRYNYSVEVIMNCTEIFSLKNPRVGIIQTVLCPKYFKKYINGIETIEDIFAKY